MLTTTICSEPIDASLSVSLLRSSAGTSVTSAVNVMLANQETVSVLCEQVKSAC